MCKPTTNPLTTSGNLFPSISQLLMETHRHWSQDLRLYTRTSIWRLQHTNWRSNGWCDLRWRWSVRTNGRWFCRDVTGHISWMWCCDESPTAERIASVPLTHCAFHWYNNNISTQCFWENHHLKDADRSSDMSNRRHSWDADILARCWTTDGHSLEKQQDIFSRWHRGAFILLVSLNDDRILFSIFMRMWFIWGSVFELELGPKQVGQSTGWLSQCHQWLLQCRNVGCALWNNSPSNTCFKSDQNEPILVLTLGISVN